MRYFFGLLLISVTILLNGCVPPVQAPTTFRVDMIAHADLNPNYLNQSTPVRVTFYQLSSAYEFEQADFFALVDDPVQVLGENLLSQQSMDIEPGQQLLMSMTLNPQTQYVGVIANYHQLRKISSQLLLSLDQNGQVLSFEGNRITLESKP